MNTIYDQDEDLRLLKEAEEQYKVDHNDADLLAAYEHVFIDRRSTLITQTRWFKIVSLYIKMGEYNKAIQWLDTLSEKHSDYYDKIQAWYDKIEKKAGSQIDRTWQENNFLQYPDRIFHTKEDLDAVTDEINERAENSEREAAMEQEVVNILLEILKEIKESKQEIGAVKQEIREIQGQLRDIQKNID